MSNESSSTYRFSCDLKIGQWADNNNWETFSYEKDRINVGELSIKTDSTTTVIPDSSIENEGQAFDVSDSPKPTLVTLKVDSASWQTVADMVRANLSDYSQVAAAGQTVTKTLIKGRSVFVGCLNIGHVSIGSLVSGTDFDVDGYSGLVTALTDEAAGPQTITYSKGGIAGNKMVSGSGRIVYIGLQGKSTNKQTGEEGEIFIPKIMITSKTALMLSGATKPQEFTFDGTVMVPPATVPLLIRKPWTFFPSISMTAPPAAP